ncbi:MAG: hypothetical protein ACR2G3_00975 [Solirubrobacterales bacterium]
MSSLEWLLAAAAVTVGIYALFVVVLFVLVAYLAFPIERRGGEDLLRGRSRPQATAATLSGDGCSATCQIEPGYACTGSPSVCTPI